MTTSKKSGLINNLSFLAMAVVLFCAFATEGWAQSDTRSSGYGASALSNIRNQVNGNGAFSAKGIQNRLLNQAVVRPGVQGINQRNFLGSGPSPLSKRSKPFSSVTRGPTVSPYLSLSAPRASASDYYSLIRPQQQKQQADRRQQMLGLQQQRKLNQLAARAPYSATGDENSAPTGHVAVFQSLGSFQNTGGYFPPPSQPKQRR